MAEESFLSKVNKYRKEIIVGLLVILLIVFMVQNNQDVTFHLVFTDMQVPLIVLILGFAALGAAIVGVYWMLSVRDKNRTIKDLSKEILQMKEFAETQKELDKATKEQE